MDPRTISKLLAPLHRRVMLMVSRAVVTLVNDSLKMQRLQLGVLEGETKDNVERFQNYGFTGVPLVGAEAVIAFIGGNRDHGIVLAVDDRRYRVVGLENGEVAIYNFEGTKVVLKKGGIIEHTAATKVRMVTPRLEVTGEIVDRCDGAGSSMHAMRGVYDTHTHAETGTTTHGPNQPMSD